MISETIQRFILTSIESVPHLEAILLLRYYDPKREWNAKIVAQALYINEKNADKILTDLYLSQILAKQNDSYFYNPVSAELKEKINELAAVYSKNLIEVTNLIHSKTNKQAQQFGDAFKWQQGKE